MVKRRRQDKAGLRLRSGKQVPTRPVSIQEIMGQPQFMLGVADVRAGRPYHKDYDVWNTNGQWGYERGRMWAALAPADVPLRLNGRINPDAARYWRREII